jgi:hypothetical protein
MLNVVMLNAVMLNVVMLNTIKLSVVAPKAWLRQITQQRQCRNKKMFYKIDTLDAFKLFL